MDKKIPKIGLVGFLIKKETGRGVMEYSFRLHRAFARRDKDVEILDLLNPSKILSRVFSNLFNYGHRENTIYHYVDPAAASAKFLFGRGTAVVTVHDLGFLRSESYTNPFKLYSGNIKSLFLKSEEHVFSPFIKILPLIGIYESTHNKCLFIFVSDSTMRDFLERFRISRERCFVIPPIISPKFKPLKKSKGKKMIVGHISSYAQNKNAGALIDAVKKVKDKNLELRLYGGKMPYKINDDKRIKYFGFVDEDKLPSIYNSFDVFVFPSVFEGFGMPIMEAKRCKVPVVTYAKAELPDVVKRNTLQFKDQADLIEILEKKKWKKVNLEMAYNDTKGCEEGNVVNEIIKVYKQALNSR